MTDQHPLTDEMIRETFNPKFFTFSGENTSSWYDEEDMRAAADWQLEQVIEWLNETIFERGRSFEAVNIPEELKEAMRPTTTQENN